MHKNIEEITKAIIKKYQSTFIITGGDEKGNYSSDYLILKNKRLLFKSKKIKKSNTHGSGCCFSTALTVFLARGLRIEEAVKKSKAYVRKKIKNSIFQWFLVLKKNKR